jgi:trans-aconitate methyltransferase
MGRRFIGSRAKVADMAQSAAPVAQSWDPERYAKNAAFVADLGAPVVDLLAPRPGERILDLGCGDGALTEKLVALGCVVVGVDASASQIEAARRRGLTAHVTDGEALRYEGEFDAVFSNAALHWMKRADHVIAGVRSALRPGGRFVAELGGHGCVAQIRGALVRALGRRGIDGESRVPWYFPTPGDYATRLERGGFRVDSIALFPRPTPLPGDVTGWLETFGEAFTGALPRDQREAYLAEVRDELQPRLADAAGRWVADYVRLRFLATRIDD